ncbi:MAG: hypothetical protein U0Q12_07920 [Vicinamibacterales bacterium]
MWHGGAGGSGILTAVAIVVAASATAKGPPIPPVHAAQPSWQKAEPVRDGDIRETYFDLQKKTELTLYLEPQPVEPGPNPTSLAFTVSYAGRELTRSALEIHLRAATNTMMFPTRLRVARLVFHVDDDEMDLTADGRAYVLNYPCPALSEKGCGFDAVDTTLDGVELLRLAHARRVTGDALGIPFALSAAQIERVRTFSSRIHP